MRNALIVVGIVFVACFYLLAFALMKAAGRGDGR